MFVDLGSSRAAIVGPLGLILAMAVLGCGQQPAPPTAVGSLPSTSTPSHSAPAIDPALVAEWTGFRQTYGLRADREYVLMVAGDPNAVHDLSVPLMPAELDLVSTRNLGVQALAPEVITYGQAFRQEYAGTFIEATRVVVQFTGRIEEHRASLKVLFGPTAPIDVRKVPYSLQDLDELARDVEAERDWFATVGAELYGASAREQTNSVRVRYIAVDESVEPAILEHFGEPEWMSLSWYGPPPWPGPWGSLRVEVVDQGGRPVDPSCSLFTDDRTVPNSYLPIGADGVCAYSRLPAVPWDVKISYESRAGDNLAVMETVRVRAGAPMVIRVVVER